MVIIAWIEIIMTWHNTIQLLLKLKTLKCQGQGQAEKYYISFQYQIHNVFS